MNFMAQSVSELSLGPTKAVTSWLTDQIAPAYWRPNSQILVNSSCCRERLCIAKTPFPYSLSNAALCRFQMLLLLLQQSLPLQLWENWSAFSSSRSWLSQRKYEQRLGPALIKRLFLPALCELLSLQYQRKSWLAWTCFSKQRTNVLNLATAVDSTIFIGAEIKLWFHTRCKKLAQTVQLGKDSLCLARKRFFFNENCLLNSCPTQRSNIHHSAPRDVAVFICDCERRDHSNILA